MTFDSKRQAASFSDTDAYYALGHRYFRVSRTYHIEHDGGKKTVTAGCRLQFYKAIVISFEQFYNMHLTGYAHEYATSGSSDM